MILVVSAQTFSQQITTTTPTLTKTDYLQKSKNQKTVAWVLLGGGTALVITGGILYESNTNRTGVSGAINGSTGLSLVEIGLVSMAGSIPFFISASKNKKKAMTTSFKMETAPIIQKNSFAQTSFPALSVKIKL